MFRKVHWIVWLCLILTPFYIDCKNVVFLPLLVASHIRAHADVAEELAKMNHTVWLGVSTVSDRKKADSYKGVITFSYSDFWDLSQDKIIEDLEATVVNASLSGTVPDFGWVFQSLDIISEGYYQAMKSGKLMDYIRSLNPDLIVLDWNPKVDERVALSYELKVPFAVLSALQDYVTGRIPFNPVAEAYNSPYFRTRANLFEKAVMVIQTMLPLFTHLFNDRGYMKRLFPNDSDVPPANELMSQAEVFIAESDSLFDYPRPVVPNLKLVGGLSTGPAKQLQEPFKSFIERSEKAGNGIAVWSFGSLFMNLPKNIETKIVSVLKRLQLNTIWRANITSPDPGKILTTTWLPQNDLLGNKNVKVFISHSGLHSLYESLYHGVPTVCLPIFFDQHLNAERAEDKNYCRTLDFIQASEDDLVRVIEEVVSSNEIKSAISTASQIYRELFKNPKQEAAFWLDHVMRYGGSYMRYSGQKIPMYLFIMDYVLVFLAGVLFTVTFLLILRLLKRAFSLCFKRKLHLKKD